MDPDTSFGAGFGTAFNTGRFGTPLDPDTITITAVSFTTDPFAVPDP
ncbi:hypothetical protein [Henriciella litoralis]|nr:hypothetical protein [Henriciella litoralis]